MLDATLAKTRIVAAPGPRPLKPGPRVEAAVPSGRRARHGPPREYEPADEAYAALLKRLDAHDFADVPAGLRADILRFYVGPAGRLARDVHDEDREKPRRALAKLDAVPSRR